MPLMNELGVAATARISFGVYSDLADLDPLFEALARAKTLFG
jgi:selenocysteine lyase/cysteine desulfurase